MAAGSSPPDAPDAPGDTGAGRSSLIAVLKRAAANFRAHEMTDRAGTLTYFAMMSLFPALLLGVTLLGLFGQQALISNASDYLLRNGADPSTAAVVRTALQKVIDSSGGALGFALFVSIALAVNGASGAFGAAGRALNTVYGVEEDRGFVRRKLVDVGATLVVIVLFAIVLVAIFLGGEIADDVLGRIGLGSTAAAAWSVARWPAALVAAMIGYGLVYAVAPPSEPAADALGGGDGAGGDAPAARSARSSSALTSAPNRNALADTYSHRSRTIAAPNTP